MRNIRQFDFDTVGLRVVDDLAKAGVERVRNLTARNWSSIKNGFCMDGSGEESELSVPDFKVVGLDV